MRTRATIAAAGTSVLNAIGKQKPMAMAAHANQLPQLLALLGGRCGCGVVSPHAVPVSPCAAVSHLCVLCALCKVWCAAVFLGDSLTPDSLAPEGRKRPPAPHTHSNHNDLRCLSPRNSTAPRHPIRRLSLVRRPAASAQQTVRSAFPSCWFSMCSCMIWRLQGLGLRMIWPSWRARLRQRESLLLRVRRPIPRPAQGTNGLEPVHMAHW